MELERRSELTFHRAGAIPVCWAGPILWCLCVVDVAVLGVYAPSVGGGNMGETT